MARRSTAILKIKTTIDAVAAECLAMLGEGAHVSYDKIENVFALNNTPISHGYVRVLCAEHIATALQYLKDAGVESDNVEIVRVEWAGQDMVQTGVDGDGNPVYEQQLFYTGDEEEIDDETGTVTGMVPVYLGRIGA